ncbi:response regulator [Flavobacterium sp. GT3R68]|uniref:response regulator n=1 Tax=Flavobacterium sp. GT3R68 TaxID=2594437 RepID=UPI000F874F28|nr:response regulator [Flavobacterium sp. GT3R68]RTY90634.1 response regulator [Flavobacterium sp. GSN2]TRW89840.1 response regulator [Flavobacterium sp. GT3R68]
MRKKIIWVVDDDPIFKIIVRKIIEKSEMFETPTTFQHGLDAITALKNSLDEITKLPDAIILDIDMPVMDGWEFMEEMIRLKPQITKKIAIYIASSSIAAEDKHKAKTFPDILNYFSKPVTLENLHLIASSD